MHENLSITDGVYEVLSEKDLQEQIGSLGSEGKNKEETKELRELVGRLLVALDATG